MMGVIKDGGTASHVQERSAHPGSARVTLEPCSCMSLRDHFAGRALVGLLHPGWEADAVDKPTLSAKHAYEIADAMLTERDKVCSPTGKAIMPTSFRGNTSEFAEADLVVTTEGKVLKSTNDDIKIIVVDHLTGKLVRA